MKSLGLFLLTAATLAAIGFGARDTALAEAINLSPYDCGNGRVAYPFTSVGMLQFAIALPLSFLLSRKLFFRGNYVKPIESVSSRYVIGFHAGSIALFLILAALLTGLLQYFDTPCAERYLDVPLRDHRIVGNAVFFSVIGLLFSNLLRYRFGPASNP